MTLRKQARRPQNPPPETEVEAFFTKINEANPKICHVGATGSSPWLTLVIGSGCSSESRPGIPKKLLESLEESVSSVYESRYYEMERLSAVTRRYLDDLIKGRLEIAEDMAEPFVPPEAFAHLCVCAALLARLYYRAKSLGSGAPSPRFEHDVATLGDDQLSWWRLKTNCIDPCVSAAEESKKRATEIAALLDPRASEHTGAPDRIRRTIEKLLSEIVAGLTPSKGPVSVSVLDVWALSDLVSMCLVSASADGAHLLWSGWDDLRLSLSYYDDPLEGCLGLPAFRSIASPADVIRHRFAAAQGTAVGGIHRATAKLLVAEAAYREKRHLEAPSDGDPGWPPAPTAFVTSLDLQLERALLEEHVEFDIALPVYVVNQRGEWAHPCWLSLRVGPGQDEQWLQSRQCWDSFGVLGDLGGLLGRPLVVRLAGCPMISLPDLTSATFLRDQLACHDSGTGDADGILIAAVRDEARWSAGATGREAREELEKTIRSLHLEHAIVLDEHDAGLHSALDLISGGGGGDALQRGDDLSLGLPPGVVAGTDRWSRYWVLLGVQIADSAIRQRIETLISSLPQKTLESRRGSATIGVAVNLDISKAERELLYWNGIDVLQADVAEFKEHLEHYADHLRDNKPFEAGGGGGCGLKDGGHA